VGGMNLNRLSLRFEDQSITGKILAMLAAERGVGTDVLIGDAATALEAGFADMLDAHLVEQIKSAVKTYLADPKSLTITAEPAQPVSVGTVIESATTDPASLLVQLPVVISANDGSPELNSAESSAHR
jgi:hypothetical protein